MPIPELSAGLFTSPVYVRTVMLMLPASLREALLAEALNLMQAAGDSERRLALAEAHARVHALRKARDLTGVEACMLCADFDQMAETHALPVTDSNQQRTTTHAY